MRKTTGKLTLSRDTIRRLSDAQLAEAAGGCLGCSSNCDSVCGFCTPTWGCPPIPPPPPSFGPPAQCWP